MKLNIHVIHSKVADSRLGNINQLVSILQKTFSEVKVTLVNDHEPETFTPDSIKSITDFSQIQDEKYVLFNSLIVPVHIRHISNLLKHALTLKQIVDSQSDDEVYVVLEDDVVFGDKVADYLVQALKSFTSSDAEFVFLGLPSPATESPTLSPFSDFYNVTPVCDSYAVTKVGAIKLLKELLPMKFQTNVQLSYAIVKADVKAFFARPNVFIDGSKLGVFVSTIDANNTLMLSNEHVNIKSLIEAGELDKAREAYDGIRFKTHPDNLRLLADLELKAKNFDKAKTHYDSCFKAYSANHCVLNNQCQFLKSYISACKDFK